jgi:hypothetical protein
VKIVRFGKSMFRWHMSVGERCEEVRLGRGKFRWLGLEKISSDCLERCHFFSRLNLLKKKSKYNTH